MSVGKRQRVVRLVLRTKAECRERIHRQSSLRASDNLEIVYREKFVILRKIMIDPQC